MELPEIIKILLPIIILQIGFQIYAIYDIFKVKKSKTRNLSPIIWTVIIVFGEIIGAALYFIAGRSEE